MLLLQHTGPVRCLAYTPDGQMLATAGDDGLVRLWDLATTQIVLTLGTRGCPVHALAFAPDGQTLAFASLRPSAWERRRRRWREVESRPLTLWDMDSRAEFQPQLDGVAAVRCLAFAPDGGTLAVGSDHDGVRLLTLPRLAVVMGLPRLARWEGPHVPPAPHPVPLGRVQGGTPTRLLYAPDGNWLVVADYDGSVAVWHTHRWPRHAALSSPGGVMAFAPDGRTLALDGRTPSTIFLIDIPTRQMAEPLLADGCVITALAFAPDGRWLAAAHGERVSLWHLQARRIDSMFKWPVGNIVALAFSPDGMTAAAADERGVVVWDVAA